MITINEYYSDVDEIDEVTLVSKSDFLWKNGSLAEIKELVCPRLFNLHVFVNLVGNWKCEGWWYIICEMVELVPYIEDALDQVGAVEIKEGFIKLMNCFPENTKFEYSEEYFDLVNFFQSLGYKVKSDNLKNIPREERKAKIRNMRNCVENLDEITNNFWGGDSAWEQAIDYIISNR